MGVEKVEKWLDVKAGSEGTRRAYKDRIKWFLTFHKIGVDELLAKPRDEVEGMLNTFLADMKKKHKAAYTRRGVKVALMSFLKFYDVNLRGDRLVKAEAEPEREDEIPSREVLDNLFEHADTREKVIMAFPAFTSMRFQGLSNLQIKHLTDIKVHGDHVEAVKTPMHIHIPKLTDGGEVFEKMGVKHETFMIAQGARYVVDYLNKRLRVGEKLGPESYVITDIKFNTEKNMGVSPAALTMAVRRHFRKMGYEERPYVLKKYCESRMLASEMKESYQKYFSGWKAGQNLIMRYGLAVKLSPEQIDELRAVYVKAEPYLTSKPQQPDMSKELKKMEEQQKIEKELMLKEIEELRKEKDKAFNIALEVRDGLRKLEEKERRDNSDGDCQRIISEEELKTWLAEGWEAKIVLPSGKIVVEK